MSRQARSAAAVIGLTLLAVAGVPPGPGAAVGAAAGSVVSPPELVVSSVGTDVGAPTLSYSGRFVAHLAVRRDQAVPRQQLRRADLQTGGSELLNPSIDGGVARGNYSRPPVVSADGSRVAFTSSGSRLVAGDTNGRVDAFVRDAAADRTLLASAASDGGVANGDSGMSSLSKNGRYAVYTSSATDVVPGSTTTNADVYRRDLSTGTTVQVTVRPDGAPSRGAGSSSADISADGNLVVFSSYDVDLARADGPDQEADLFVRTMTTGQTRWISAGLPVGADPSGVGISPDGRWVSSRWADGSLHLTSVGTGVTSQVAAEGYSTLGSFSSRLPRLVYMTGGQPHVRDLTTGADAVIPTPDGGTVSSVTVSGDGRFAAYDFAPDGGGPSRIYRVEL